MTPEDLIALARHLNQPYSPTRRCPPSPWLEAQYLRLRVPRPVAVLALLIPSTPKDTP